MTEIQTLFRELYAAFNARDIDAVFRHLTPDVDWANGMSGGRVVGQDAVRAYWTEQWRQIDPRVEPVEIRMGDEGEVVVEVHQVVRDLMGELILDTRVDHIYQMQNGQVTRMDIRQREDASSPD